MYNYFVFSTQICMDDIPTSSLASIDELPGQIYSADEQCQIAGTTQHLTAVQEL